ncbi:MAG: TlpA family protein disulfide reductase [Acidimicrobiia bacterium]|nr:TlpA family protein disulfide reductase [Acidimicrobiia bacterium]
MARDHGAATAASAPHPDDRPAEQPARRIPRGLVVASLLAGITLVVIAVVSLTTGEEEPPTRLQPHAPEPPPPTVAAPVGAPISDLTLETFDGGELTLTDLAGQPLVVNFWGSWCAPCLAEMPDLQRLHERFAGRAHVVGLNVADGEDRARAFARDLGITYALAWDTDGVVLRQVGGTQMPTTVFVDAGGQIVDVVGGILDEAGFADRLEAMGA